MNAEVLNKINNEAVAYANTNQNYDNMTDEQKMYYVMFISRILGLGSDATIERITPSVAMKVDEFISAAEQCTRRLAIFSVLVGFLPFNTLYSYVGNIGTIGYVLGEIEAKLKRANAISIMCYFTLKRNYANEVLLLFFNGE